MAYKTILVHVDHSRHAELRVRTAAGLAVAHGAHLIGTAMSGISRYVYQDSGMDLERTILSTHIDALFARAEAALDRFDATAAAVGAGSRERRLVDDEIGAALVTQARYADLVVVSQSDPHDPVSAMAPDLPGYVALAGARPVLILPYAGAALPIDGTVLLAWDASLEATRALTCAIALLRRAARVVLAVVNPSDAHGEQPGADIALYLARHGVQVEVLIHTTDGDVGEALLSLAADSGAGLIVMGAYGHSRLREMLLGGVTAHMLKSMTVPVLMAH